MSCNNLLLCIAEVIDHWPPPKLVNRHERYWVKRRGSIRNIKTSQTGYSATIVVPFDSSHSWVEIEALIDIEVSPDEVKWRVWGDSHLISKDKVEEFITDVKVGLMSLTKQICKKE